MMLFSVKILLIFIAFFTPFFTPFQPLRSHSKARYIEGMIRHVIEA